MACLAEIKCDIHLVSVQPELFILKCSCICSLLLSSVSVRVLYQLLNPLCYVLQYWTDIYLSWNPESYPGVQNLRFPSNLVWVPDILLYNR